MKKSILIISLCIILFGCTATKDPDIDIFATVLEISTKKDVDHLMNSGFRKEASAPSVINGINLPTIKVKNQLSIYSSEKSSVQGYEGDAKEIVYTWQSANSTDSSFALKYYNLDNFFQHKPVEHAREYYLGMTLDGLLDELWTPAIVTIYFDANGNSMSTKFLSFKVIYQNEKKEYSFAFDGQEMDTEAMFFD